MRGRLAVAPRPSPRLSRRHERLVWAILGLTWLSGALWLLFRYGLQQAGEFGPLPHPLQGWWLRLHGAAAFAALWLFGLLWGLHIPRGWAQGRRRRSGGSVALAAGVLVLSGWLLYYGSEDLRAFAAPLHWGLGLAALPLALLHMRRRRRGDAAAVDRLSPRPPDAAA